MEDETYTMLESLHTVAIVVFTALATIGIFALGGTSESSFFNIF